MKNIYLWIGLGALIVIVVGLLVSGKLTSSLTKKGFKITAEKPEDNSNNSDIEGDENKVKQGNSSSNKSVIKGNKNIVEQSIDKKNKK